MENNLLFYFIQSDLKTYGVNLNKHPLVGVSENKLLQLLSSSSQVSGKFVLLTILQYNKAPMTEFLLSEIAGI